MRHCGGWFTNLHDYMVYNSVTSQVFIWWKKKSGWGTLQYEWHVPSMTS
jgi:hypothetical protein